MSKNRNHYLVLESLFGSKLRVKILKFLFRNYPAYTGLKELARRIQEPVAAVGQEIKIFEKTGLINRS